MSTVQYCACENPQRGHALAPPLGWSCRHCDLPVKAWVWEPLRQALLDDGLLPSPESLVIPSDPRPDEPGDDGLRSRIRGYFPADPLTAKGAAPTPENHALGSPPGFALVREDLLMPGAAGLLSRVDFKTGPIPGLAHPGELLIALGKPTDNHRSMMPVVVAFHSADGVFVLDSGEVSALDLAKAGEVVIRAKLPERPVVAAGADNFTASQLKRRRDRLERRLAHLQARTADRDPRTVQYDTAEASALQTALALFDDAIAVRAPARRWLKDQVASIDPDLPAAEMSDEQMRGVVGVHILRLRRHLDEAEAALDRRTAEVEASNFRHGELVAERAALRRELEGQTDRVEELEAKLMITKQRASVLEDLARAYGAPIPK